jgi:hypothetical protein
MAGVSVAESLELFCFPTKTNDDDRKYRFLVHWKRMAPWWLRLLLGLVMIFTKNFFGLCQKLFCLPSSRRDPVLVMTVKDDEMMRPSTHGSTSGDMEMRGLVNSPKSSSSNNSILPSSRNRFLTILGSVCGVSSVLVVISSLGPMVVHTSTGKNALSVIVSWLCAVGLVISSLMNGFGSVSMPYTCLAGLYLKPVRPEVITKLEAERQSIQTALENKRATLREMTVAISSRQNGFSSSFNTATKNKTTGLVTGVRSFADLGDELSNRRQILQTEITFLEDLYKEMGEDVEELRHSQVAAAQARTTMGRIRSYAGLVFSVVLLVRLLSAGWSIWKSYAMNTDRHKVAHGDIVTTVLLWLMGHDFVSSKDYTLLSQLVSLVLTAGLSFTQVRTFLRTLAAVHQGLNRFYQKCYCGTTNSKSESSSIDELPFHSTVGIYSQVIAGATGCYFLSCIVLIKMMLPEEFCEGFSTAMGGMDVFTIHTSVVNTVFACSAGVSVTILALTFGIQRQNNFRHTTSKDIAAFGPDAC